MNDKFFGSAVRRRILSFVIISFSLLIVFQLFKMQLLDNFTYQEKSRENSIKKDLIPAPRGVFYDRNMQVIVSNKPSFSVDIIPDKYDEKNSALIEDMLGVDHGYIEKILNEYRKFSKFQPITIKRNADFNCVAWLQENEEELPGVKIDVDLQRDYSYGINGSHTFGYAKEISAEQYRKLKDTYDMGDYIGFSGIEKTYENLLRGDKGYTLTLVDARQKTIGKYLKGTEDVSPRKGDDLILGLDAASQKIAETDFKGKKGALVAIEPSTGEIIALVSAPQYDLSAFSSVTSSKVWSKLNNDKDKPLFNRATMAIYPPGSTFKMVSALAALNEGVINENYTINCAGGYQFGDRYFRCLHVHGKVNVVDAIKESCNTFFYQLILKIGLDKWSQYASELGFGSTTGIDISEETAGILPDSAYYNRVYGKRGWTKGFLISLGIGQGELSATPLQLAQYTALIANNGNSYKPHLVKSYIDKKNGNVIPLKFAPIHIKLKQKALDIVKKGMYKVVNEDGGTATNIRMQDIKIAGKTGTAQNPHGEDHSIFIGFAPFENPQIAVAVIVENAGYGSTSAAPIARDVIKTFLDGKRNKNKPKQYISALDK